MIFFTSDQHFYHKNIIRYTGRPFSSVAEMNETLIQNHNSVVEQNDDVYFFGDFAFCSLEWQRGILSKLNGKKYLFLGNHDRSESAMRSLGFADVFHSKDMSFGGKVFRMSHYPFIPSNPGPYDTKYLDRRPSREGCDWLLCGHVHEKWKILENQINVGVDVWDFKPISIDTILEITSQFGE